MFVQSTTWVFVPTPAARTKQLRLHGCNILGTQAPEWRCYCGNYSGHITSMLCFLQDCFQESYTGSLQGRQLEQWDCLCWSLPLCYRKSQSQKESLEAAQFTQLWQCFHVCGRELKFSPGKLLQGQQTQGNPPWYHPLVQPGWQGGCPCCLTDWLTFKREHLIQRPGKMQDGTEHIRVHAIGDSPKFWEPKSCFLLMSHRTWELRRETSAESQWKWSFSSGNTSSCNGFGQLSRAAFEAVWIHHFQGVLPVLRNTTL